MLIKQLIDLYKQLEENGEVKLGWNTSATLHYGIDISDDGKVMQIIPFVTDKKPKVVVAPGTITKETGATDFDKFLYGTARYFIGYDKTGNRKASFEHTKTYHDTLLKNADSKEAIAIKKYFEYYLKNRDELLNLFDFEKNKDYFSSNFCLCYRGIPLTENEEMKSIWETEFNRKLNAASDKKAISLVSGEYGAIAKTHGTVSVPGGTNPSLISFNAESFESYNMSQSYNSSITVKESIMYASALNYMLKRDDYHVSLGDSTLVMWTANANPEYSAIAMNIMGMFQKEKSNISQQDILKIANDVRMGRKIEVDEKAFDNSEPFYIASLTPNGGRVKLDFYYETSFGDLISNIAKHYERLELENAQSSSLTPYQILQETVFDAKKLNHNLQENLLLSILKNTYYPSAIYSSVLNRIIKERNILFSKEGVTKFRRKMQITKAYLLQNTNSEKEVLEVGLNKETKSVAYQCGRLFAVLEKIQRDATGAENMGEKHFASAMITPANALTKCLRLSQYYMRKLQTPAKIMYNNLIQEITGKIDDFPKHNFQIAQGEFCLGYYHQKQELWRKKSDNKEENING